MILLELSDFNKFYRLAQSDDVDPIIQDYIDRFEEVYIKKMLGVELGQLFILDIQGLDSDSAAIEERFQILLDGFIKQKDNDGDVVWQNIGMKNTLAGLVYYHYVIDTQGKHSQSGYILNKSEVSGTGSPQEAAGFAEEKWNGSLPSIYAIQWWCGCEDSDNYPEYNGVYFRPVYSNLL